MTSSTPPNPAAGFAPWGRAFDFRPDVQLSEQGLIAAVAVFVRSPSHYLGPTQGLLDPRLPRDVWIGLLAGAPLEVRANVARLHAALWLCSARQVPLVLAEGWRSSVVAARPRIKPRVFTGTTLMRLLIRRLTAHGLAPMPSALRLHAVSVCTAEEVEVILGLCPNHEIWSVAGPACPSVRRAAHYLRAQGDVRAGRVFSSQQALQRAGFDADSDPAQPAFLAALRRSAPERIWDFAFEFANWSVHLASRALGGSVARGFVLERALARRLRGREGPRRRLRRN